VVVGDIVVVGHTGVLFAGCVTGEPTLVLEATADVGTVTKVVVDVVVVVVVAFARSTCGMKSSAMAGTTAKHSRRILR